MFSLNVPLPPAVPRLARDLRPALAGFDRVRERHTLVGKRFGVDDVSGERRPAPDRSPGQASGQAPDRASDPAPDRTAALAALRRALRPLFDGVDPFDVAIRRIGAFDRPTQGPGPVVYLAVESEPLERLHRRLCAAFGPIEGIEGDDYVPHVTLARGGTPAAADALDALVRTPIDPIEWRVHELELYDADFREVAGRVRL